MRNSPAPGESFRLAAVWQRQPVLPDDRRTSPMSAYAKLLDIAQHQAAAALSGDVDAAVELMDARAEIIATAPPATTAEKSAIEEVLKLDRQLAGFIRQRMLDIREQALAADRGKTALRGYGALPTQLAPGVRINSAR